MGEWIKGCELCNSGLVIEMDRLIEGGISVRKAAEMLAAEGERKIGDLVYSAAAIRARYLHHKGLLKRSRDNKVVGSQPPKSDEDMQRRHEQFVAFKEERRRGEEEPGIEIEDEAAQEDEPPVKPNLGDLSARYHIGAAKESAKAAERAKITPLQRIAMHAKGLSRGLENIIEGRVKAEGKYDHLFAEGIKRKGPGIIISYYQLGIDPQKAVDFYHGRRSDESKTVEDKKTDKQGTSRNSTAIEDHSKKKK